jgi:hypothetical protein
LENLAQALRIDDDAADKSLQATLEQCAQTTVRPILTTFSVERRFVALTFSCAINANIMPQRFQPHRWPLRSK